MQQCRIASNVLPTCVHRLHRTVNFVRKIRFFSRPFALKGVRRGYRDLVSCLSSLPSLPPDQATSPVPFAASGLGILVFGFRVVQLPSLIVLRSPPRSRAPSYAVDFVCRGSLQFSALATHRVYCSLVWGKERRGGYRQRRRRRGV